MSMIADEPTPRARAVEQVMEVLNGQHLASMDWSVLDVFAWKLMQGNHNGPTIALKSAEHGVRRLAEAIVDRFNIQVFPLKD